MMGEPAGETVAWVFAGLMLVCAAETPEHASMAGMMATSCLGGSEEQEKESRQDAS